MKWHFLNSGFSTGLNNMDFDVSLAINSNYDEGYFRLYKWKPYCISIGANQRFDTLNIEKARLDGIDLVKRPTGGRAILHSEELTYSVIFPLNVNSSARNIYHEINMAIKNGLRLYDEKLSQIELEDTQPNFNKIYKEEISSICFAVSAKSEIKYSGKKLVGSAQRKFGNVILQHGSILCGGFHKKVIDYLNISQENLPSLLGEIEATTTDLNSILGIEINYNRLESAITKGFRDYFNVEMKESEKPAIIEYNNEISIQ